MDNLQINPNGKGMGMKICIFFGHRNTQATVKPRLMSCVESLIVEHGVTKFYVGNQGNFDRMAKSVPQILQKNIPTSYTILC